MSILSQPRPLAAVIIALALFDTALTWIGVTRGVVQELNPLMRALLDRGDVSFILYKLVVVGLLYYMIFVKQVVPKGMIQIGLWVVLFVHVVAAVAHGAWFIQLAAFHWT